MHFHSCSVALLLLTVALPVHSVRAQSDTKTQATWKDVDTAIEAARVAAKIPGVNVAIGRDGRIVYERGFGLADVENDVKATPHTRFRTASIAKPMTAVCVMQLHEQKKLDLDRPFHEIYARWPKKRWPLTCRQLLGHLGGVRHYNRLGEASGTKRYLSVQASLDCFQNDALLHEPGTKYHYTTYGYSLLGVAVERAAKTTFGRYLQKNVWDRAGMAHSTLDDHFALIPGRARGYRLEGNQLRNCEMHDTSMKIPGGGLRSTASDLVRFGLAMLGDQLVQPATRKRMWTRQQTKSGEATGYGLGFRVGRRDGMRVIGHTGGQAGTTCFLVILPEKATAFAVMSNLYRAKLAPMRQILTRAVTDR